MAPPLLYDPDQFSLAHKIHAIVSICNDSQSFYIVPKISITRNPSELKKVAVKFGFWQTLLQVFLSQRCIWKLIQNDDEKPTK